MAADTGSEKIPGWQANELGGLTLSITIRGEDIRLATVTYDAETGLFETYIGLPFAVASEIRCKRDGAVPVHGDVR